MKQDLGDITKTSRETGSGEIKADCLSAKMTEKNF